ncbi:MAG: MFS transporter [Gemmatimonadetes bacterium]|nr:MFS transporter [Gemmatimonadota bacterium]
MAETPAAGTAVRAVPLTARLGALGHPAYRRFWLGSLASVGGVQLQVLAQAWLVFELTGSPLDLGLLGAATAVPAILMTLFGGVLADRLDKRALIVATSGLTASLLLLLGILDVRDVVRVWHVYAVAASIGLVNGIEWPARQAVFPLLIERRQMASAVALNSILWQATRIAAPAVGGPVMAAFGTPVIFFAGAAGFFIMLLVMLTLRVRKVPAHPAATVQQFRQGVAFIAATRLFAVLIPLTYANMFFGLSYMQLMPAFAAALGAGESGYGYLLSAIGAGSVTGTAFAGLMQNVRRAGWAMLGCMLVSAFLVIVFTVSRVYALSLLLAFAAAVFNSVFLITSMTVLQLRVPDELRGRVMGIHGITFSLIPLGALFVGAIAAATGVRYAVAVSAGILFAIILAVAATQREVRSLGSGSKP